MDKRLVKQILTLALPAVVSNITTPLLALSDTAIVGHMGSTVLMAAVAVGSTMFNLLYWLFGFLRMGASGLTAQAWGAQQLRQAHALLTRSLLLASVIGLLMIALQTPIADLLLGIIDAGSETRLAAMEYYRICIWGAPAVLCMASLTGWCIGMQDTRLPMYTSIFIVAFNILVSVTLVFVFGMRLRGVALGTLSAQWCGFLLCLLLALRRYGFVILRPRELFEGILGFFRINGDIYLRTLCLVAVTLWFTRVGALQGPVMLAVNALLMQLFTLFSFFMDGLAFSAEALCGRYAGAGDAAMLRRTVRYLMAIGLALAAAFTLGYVCLGRDILALLSDEQQVLAMADRYLPWAMAIPLTGFAAFMYDGVFIGLTRTRAMLVSMAVATAVFFLIYSTLYPRLANHALWLAFLSYLLMRGVVLNLLYRRASKRAM